MLPPCSARLLTCGIQEWAASPIVDSVSVRGKSEWKVVVVVCSAKVGCWRHTDGCLRLRSNISAGRSSSWCVVSDFFTFPSAYVGVVTALVFAALDVEAQQNLVAYFKVILVGTVAKEVECYGVLRGFPSHSPAFSMGYLSIWLCRSREAAS